MAVTVSEAGEDGVAVPFAGETLSQEPPEEVVVVAVKESEPAPVLETRTCWVSAPLPWVAVKLTFCVSTPSRAVAPGCTVRMTATVVVEGTAFGAVIVIVPWYVPAARLAGLELTAKTAGMGPLAGLTLSHVALVEAVNESPATEEERLIVCGLGALPPAIAEKFKLAGVNR